MNKILEGLRDRMGDVFGCLSKAEEAHAAGKKNEACGHLGAASNQLGMVAAAVSGLEDAVRASRPGGGESHEQ